MAVHVEEPADVGSDGEHFGDTFDPARADLFDGEIAGVMGTASFVTREFVGAGKAVLAAATSGARTAES